MINGVIKSLIKTSTASRRRAADSQSRERSLHEKRLRSFQILEQRTLLASDIVIGLSPSGAFTRTMNGAGDTATYQATDPVVTIAALDLQNDLNAGLNVVVTTASAALSAGNLFFQNNSIVKLTGGNTTLSLLADQDLVLDTGIIRSDAGRLSLVLNSDRDNSGSGSVVVIGSTIETLGGNIAIGVGANPFTSPARGTAISFGVEIETTTLDSGINGNISILGRGFDGGLISSPGVAVSGASNITASGTGTISISGVGGNNPADSNRGVLLSSSTLSTELGPITIIGTATGSGASQVGLSLANGQTLTTINGDITLTGTGSANATAGTTTNQGVALTDAGDVITTTGNGNIDIIATAGRDSDAFDLQGTLGGATAAGSIGITADSIALGATALLQSTSALSIRPSTPSIDISISPGGTGPGLAIDTDRLVDGFSGILIGGASFSTVNVAASGATFRDPVLIFGGSITVTGGLTGNGGIFLASLDGATAGQDITITDGDLTDTTGDIMIVAGDNFTLTPTGSIKSGGPLLSITVDASGGAEPGIGGEASILGTITSSSDTEIVGGTDADLFTITPQSGTALAISGDDPTAIPGDRLNIDGGGNDITIDVETNSFVQTGARPILISGIENLNLSNVRTLTVNVANTPDLISVAKNPGVAGGDLITINGGTPIAISTVANLIINGLGGDDFFGYNTTAGAITVPVTFNGGLQDNTTGGDILRVDGSFTTQVLNYQAAGAEGNNGDLVLDGTTVTYTGLEPIVAGNSVDTILNFNTGVANNVTLRDNPSAGLIEIVDNGSTFEDTQFPNPTNSLTINLGAFGDQLNVAALDSAYAASPIISGGAGVDNVHFTGVTITSTPGRGLDVTGVETLGITGSTFSNNTAAVGGGLRVIGGVTTIDSSTFSNNVATGAAANQGGGAFLLLAVR